MKNKFKVQFIFDVKNKYPLNYWVRMVPLHKILKNLFLTLLGITKIGNISLGFKAAKRAVMLSLDLKEVGFMYESEIVVKAVRMKYKLAQIPVRYKRRMREVSQVNLIKDGLKQMNSVIYYGLLVKPPSRPWKI